MLEAVQNQLCVVLFQIMHTNISMALSTLYHRKGPAKFTLVAVEMGKLNAALLRYLTGDEFRVLTGVSPLRTPLASAK